MGPKGRDAQTIVDVDLYTALKRNLGGKKNIYIWSQKWRIVNVWPDVFIWMESPDKADKDNI